MSLPLLRYSCLIIETEHAQAGECVQTEATVEQSVQHVNTFQTITSRKIILSPVYQVCAKFRRSGVAVGAACAPHRKHKSCWLCIRDEQHERGNEQ